MYSLISLPLKRIGFWMQRNFAIIRGIQWIIVFIYGILIIIPVILPLPNDFTHISNNFTIFAQFIFWGIWWPFVLLSIIIIGRVWCGVFCPEGTLTEFASCYGLGKTIPHWMRWKGWSFIGFSTITIYGQMISVYQYPKAILIVLGGSTIIAIIIGFVYGREKRVWCKYLCPVNRVFGLLAKLSPFHYKVNEKAWKDSYNLNKKNSNIFNMNCAPLVPLRTTQSSSECHMCGRCAGYRNAITLTSRSPSYEIIFNKDKHTNFWDTALILYGLMGIAIGSFHWSISPLFILLKQNIANWLVNNEIMWPLDIKIPWFILTHYPEHNDVFTWLDGILLIFYILITAIVYGSLILLSVIIGVFCTGKWQISKLHHFTQALIPTAACGVFLGLSRITLSMLRFENIQIPYISSIRICLLLIANLWTIWLIWNITKKYTSDLWRRLGTVFSIFTATIIADSAWILIFYIW